MILAQEETTPTSDEAVTNAFGDILNFVTTVAGPAVIGIAVAALTIMLGIRWVRRAFSQAK